MTRLWPEGDPIAVTADDCGEPVAFVWQACRHRVTDVLDRWLVDVDWWRGRVWRAHAKVSTDTGLLVVIYQDLLSGDWYLQRLYD